MPGTRLLPSLSFRPSSVSRIDLGWPGRLMMSEPLAHHRDLPREDRGGHEFQADPAHLLAEPGHELVGDREA